MKHRANASMQVCIGAVRTDVGQRTAGRDDSALLDPRWIKQ